MVFSGNKREFYIFLSSHESIFNVIKVIYVFSNEHNTPMSLLLTVNEAFRLDFM